MTSQNTGMNTIIHNLDYILNGIFIWLTTLFAFKLPTIPMLYFILSAFNITHILPYLQAGVYSLAMLVSIFTLEKLSMEMKLYSKFKKWKDKK